MRGEVKRFKKVSKLEAYRSDGSPKTSSSPSLPSPSSFRSVSFEKKKKELKKKGKKERKKEKGKGRGGEKKRKHAGMKRETIQLRGRTSKAATRNEFFHDVVGNMDPFRTKI